MKVSFGDKPTRNASGKLGTTVHVETSDGGWRGVYRFDTHGLSADETVAKIGALGAYHAKKCARLDGFGAVLLSTFKIGPRSFVIVDCTLREVAGEVELYVDVREGESGVDGFPWRRRFATIDDVPDNTSIVAQATARVQAVVDAQQAHADFVARVKNGTV